VYWEYPTQSPCSNMPMGDWVPIMAYTTPYSGSFL